MSEIEELLEEIGELTQEYRQRVDWNYLVSWSAYWQVWVQLNKN